MGAAAWSSTSAATGAGVSSLPAAGGRRPRSPRSTSTPGGTCPIVLENAAGTGDTVGPHLRGAGGQSSTPPARRRAGSGSASTPSTCGRRASTTARWRRRTTWWPASTPWSGLDRLRCLHLNDSKVALGANRDRHENIGEGTIGADGAGRPALAPGPGRGCRPSSRSPGTATGRRRRTWRRRGPARRRWGSACRRRSVSWRAVTEHTDRKRQHGGDRGPLGPVLGRADAALAAPLRHRHRDDAQAAHPGLRDPQGCVGRGEP